MNFSRGGRDFAQSREILCREPAYQEYENDMSWPCPLEGGLLMISNGRGCSASKLIWACVLLCLGFMHPQVGFGQNPPPPPGLALTNLSATSATLALMGASNHVIIIQASADYASWIVLGTTQLNATGRGQFTDTGAGVSGRLYRAFDDAISAYSSNIVGFARLMVPASGDFVGNPFLSTNTVATLLPNMPNGIVLLKIGAAGYVANNFLNGWSSPGMTLLPGEGFLVKNAPAGGITMNFFGELVQGSTNRLPPGLVLVSSVLPRSGPLQFQLQFPADDGDAVYIFNPGSGGYNVYEYFAFDGWFPGEPSLNVGQAFWCNKSSAADWIQTLGGAPTYRIVQSAPTSSIAQVNFFTYNRTAGFGRVFRADGTTPLGTNFLAQLYAGTNSAEAGLVKVGTPVAFLSGTGAGYIRAGIVNINGVAPGQTVYLQVRAWDSAAGTSYEAAVTAGRARGKSAIFTLTAGGDVSYMPLEANNFASFSLGEPPIITLQPVSATVLAGNTAQFTVSASGSLPMGFHWRRGTVVIATNQPPNTNTSTLTLSNVQTNQAGNYTVIVSNSVGSVTSTVAVLTVLADSDGDGMPDAWEIAYGLSPNDPTDASLDYDGDGMTNREEYIAGTDPTNPQSVFRIFASQSGGSIALFSSSTGAVLQSSSSENGPWSNLPYPLPATLPISAQQAFFRLEKSGVFSVNTIGYVNVAVAAGSNWITRPMLGNADNRVESLIPNPPSDTCVYKWIPATGGYDVACYFDGSWEGPVIQLQPGERFWLQNPGPAFTITFLGEVIPATPPTIIGQPQSQTVIAGSNATFSVTANGTSPLMYQWYKGSTTVPGATNPVYTINSAGAANAGSYLVTIGNSVGSVTSVVATLTVRFPPTITQQPQSRSILSSSNVVFSVTAAGDPPLTYQWYFANTPIPHATNATLSLINVQLGQGGDYYVVISNAFGFITSSVAALTVSPCSTAPSGLVASWKGEGNAFDAVSDNHGVLSNGVTFAPGKVGQAFSFNGNTSQVVIPSSPSFHIQNAFTLMAWVNSQSSNGFIITRFDSSSSAGIGLMTWPAGNFRFQIDYGPTQVDLYSITTIQPGIFQHVAATYDGAVLQLYVNGNLEASVRTNAAPDTDAPLTIGGVPAAPFTGTIDEAAIFNRALSSNEIAAIYAAGSLGMCVPAPLPGAPVILVNGRVTTNAVTQANAATVTMQTPVSNGAIYFTLDGSDPDNFTDALRYNGPFMLTESATIRAVAYSTDFTSGVEGDPVTVIIAHGPAILAQPQNQTTATGSSAQFSVIATGDAPLRYQWRKNGVNIPGATAPSLLLSNVQPSAVGDYLAVVTNLYGAITSAVARLTVIQAPTITNPPANVSTTQNARVVFCVQALGDALRFQWRKNGVNIPGATNQCYTNPSVRIADGGFYSVAIENAIDAIESLPAKLTIDMPFARGSDTFAGRTTITESCFSGSNLGATNEPGEPFHAGKVGGKSIWYKWIAPSSGIATFETTGSSFDTLLAVYTGTNVTALTPIAADEDRGGFLNSVVRFNAQTNKEYAIVVDGYAGAEGTYTICWKLEAAPAPLPVIIQQPRSSTVLSNQPYTFSVVATSTAPRIAYQWFFNSRALTNETNATLQLPHVLPQHVGFYWAGISNSGVGLLSDIAVLEIGPFANIQSVGKLPDLFAFPTNRGPFGGFALSAITAAAAESSGAGIFVGAGSTDSQVVNNTGSASGNDPAPCRVLGGTRRYLLFLATNNATMRVDTFGSVIDTVLGMLIGTSPSSAAPSMCNDDAAVGLTSSLLQFSVTNGNAYYIQADGKSAAEGSIFINWAVGFGPTNSQSRTSYLVLQGDTVTLTNAGNGTPPPTFQWWHDNVAVLNATNRLLSLTNIQPTGGGTYSVVASNTLGVITNTIAVLTVDSSAFAVAREIFGSPHFAWGSSNATLFYEGSGGNDGGYLSNRVTQGIWRLLMPPEYSNSNKFHCYDGLLSFDVRLLTGSLLSDPELSLEGHELRLVLELSPKPVTSSWTTYHVLLSESAPGWGWYNPTNFGTPITRGQMLFVLSTLTNIVITGQFDSTGGSLGIDNVILLAPTTPVLWVRRDGEDWLVEWPWAIGSYDVESMPTFSEQGWTVLSAPLTVNGSLNSMRQLSTNQQFFRLRKNP